MLAGIGLGIRAVLGIQLQSLLRRLRRDGAVDLRQVVVDRQLTGLAGFVFDGCDNISLSIGELQSGKV